MANTNNFNNIKVKGIHDFADDYLTTIFCLLKSAEKNKNNDDVFTYTLPIIILSVCFLESNINNIIYLFSMPNNIVNDYTKAKFIYDIASDFKIIDKSILDKYVLLLKHYKNKDIKSNNRYEKVSRVIEVRNALVHDKQKNDEQAIMPIVKKIEKLYPDFIKDENINGIIPPWLPYLGYNSICWVLKCVFEFYLYYTELLFDKNSITYELKIKNILKHITK